MSGVATPADGITTDVASTTESEAPTAAAEVTVDVVVAALAPTTETTDDEPGWSVHDPIFWETVNACGAPLLRHPVDMVLYRGPHKRVITVFDAVIDDGRGRHR